MISLKKLREYLKTLIHYLQKLLDLNMVKEHLAKDVLENKGFINPLFLLEQLIIYLLIIVIFQN